MEPVEGRVKAALERAGYTGGDVLLVVAVSGGSDSLALLHSLLSLRESAGLRLHVAHLNHNFRDDAEEDARFVSAVARQLGLPATVEKADPVAYQKEMRISSFEEAAREVRYSFLAKVASANAAASVALGHTTDDLAETVLMHIIRGSGIHGLRGMSELSTWQSRISGQQAVLFRPLLEATKKDTTAYCRKRGITFREDPGNRLMRFTRNRVRHQLLPTLGSYNPRIREALVRLAHSASLEVDYLEKEVATVWTTAARREGDSIVLDARLLALLHPLMQRMVLRRAYGQLAGDTRRLEEVHLKTMADFINRPGGTPPGKVLDLPRGLRFYTSYDQLILGLSTLEAQCPFPPLEGEHEIPLPTSVDERSTEISGWQVLCTLGVTTRLVASSEATLGDPFTACFDLEAIGDRFRVRTRLPGDRFQPLGMQAEKKLQDFFVDEKVPRAWRDRIPLVVSERGIAWVVGYRIAHWARVERSKQTSPLALWVRFERRGEGL